MDLASQSPGCLSLSSWRLAVVQAVASTATDSEMMINVDVVVIGVVPVLDDGVDRSEKRPANCRDSIDPSSCAAQPEYRSPWNQTDSVLQMVESLVHAAGRGAELKPWEISSGVEATPASERTDAAAGAT